MKIRDVPISQFMDDRPAKEPDVVSSDYEFVKMLSVGGGGGTLNLRRSGRESERACRRSATLRKRLSPRARRRADTQLPMAAKGAKPINLQHGLHGATQGVHELCYRDIRVVYCIIYFHKRSLKDPFYIFAPVGFWKTTRRTFFSKISFHPTPPHPVGSALIQCLSKLARDTRPATQAR